MTRAFGKYALNRRRLLQVATAGVAMTALGACTRALSEIAGLGTDVTKREDLVYGPKPRQALDLYLPPNATAETPLVLFLYGGSWKWGSKERYGFVAYPLAERGLAVAVADYRLYPEVKFPDFNHDAATAAAWLQRERQNLGLGPGPLHLMGHSAGAHIAALLALDPQYLAAAKLDQGQLGRFVGLSGPYGFYPSQIDFVSDIFPPADQEDQARPLTFAKGDAPDMLLLHGADDGLVSPRNSTELAAAQISAGADASARLYPEIGHKEMVLAFTPPFQGLAPAIDDTVAFLTGGLV